MRDNILFHITTREDWKKYQISRTYQPESLESEGFIHCSSGPQLEDTVNRLFGDKQQILLLVIDSSMIREDIKYEKDEKTGKKYPHIYAPLSVNAVIDKIDVKPEENGKYKIDFNTD